jgi:hypothetical protein
VSVQVTWRGNKILTTMEKTYHKTVSVMHGCCLKWLESCPTSEANCLIKEFITLHKLQSLPNSLWKLQYFIAERLQISRSTPTCSFVGDYNNIPITGRQITQYITVKSTRWRWSPQEIGGTHLHKWSLLQCKGVSNTELEVLTLACHLWCRHLSCNFCKTFLKPSSIALNLPSYKFSLGNPSQQFSQSAYSNMMFASLI